MLKQKNILAGPLIKAYLVNNAVISDQMLNFYIANCSPSLAKQRTKTFSLIL